MEHFVVAADLSRVVGDWVFQAAALEGQASAKVGGCWLRGQGALGGQASCRAGWGRHAQRWADGS